MRNYFVDYMFELEILVDCKVIFPTTIPEQAFDVELDPIIFQLYRNKAVVENFVTSQTNLQPFLDNNHCK